ncbi:hypothetical protein C7B76_24285 [filamentous cyanobacterium CCP2]|nr:hypothetical protein C7B76_24285 [filamentous cyanobacterium CCP2]
MVTALKSSNSRQLKPRSRRNVPLGNEQATAASVRLGQPARLRNRSIAPPTVVDPSVVTALPSTQPAPSWLKLLIHTQRASLVLTFLLVGSALAVYGWTVFIQRHWGQEYHRLQLLKKHERQLIAGNEALKNQMAEQAEAPNSGLMVPDPSNAFFLAPAPARPLVDPQRHPDSQDVPTKPLGY